VVGDPCAWGALIRSSCKSTGFGTRLSLFTPRAVLDREDPNEKDARGRAAVLREREWSEHGILGARLPNLWRERWRWFYTQQHGDNPTYEVEPAD
jgi:hypothetical protein